MFAIDTPTFFQTKITKRCKRKNVHDGNRNMRAKPPVSLDNYPAILLTFLGADKYISAK